MTATADELLLDDVLALLDYVIEDLLERGQVIVVPNHSQLSDKRRVLVLLGLLIPNLRLKIRQARLRDILHINLQSLARLGEPRRLRFKLEAANLPNLCDWVQEVIET